MTSPPPRVFISYSHETMAHQERVVGLADRLRSDGIDADVDQYNDSPSEGWPVWCERQIDRADFVLIVCTDTYHRRVRGEERPGTGLGVIWEAAIIRQRLYDAGVVSNKFVPVFFSDGSPEHIPTPIRAWSHYAVDADAGYERLYRRLTQQPQLPKPALGPIRTLPAKDRRWSRRTTATLSCASPTAQPVQPVDREAQPEPRQARRRTGTIAAGLGGVVTIAMAALAASFYGAARTGVEYGEPVAAQNPGDGPSAVESPATESAAPPSPAEDLPARRNSGEALSAKRDLRPLQERPHAADRPAVPAKEKTPSPAATALASRPSAACAHILQRLQLGEAVSEKDRSYLRESCR